MIAISATQSGALCEASAMLYREAEYLDARRWDEWIALYLPECTDPRTQLSLIYYASRDGLADRVERIRSGTSVASNLTPRTMHAITNTRLIHEAPGERRVRSNFSVDVYDLRRHESARLFGHYEHELHDRDDGWKIARKKIVVLNDLLPPVVDIYSL